MEVSEVKLVDLARMPGPTHYLNPLKQARGDTAFHFGQAARKTGFEVPKLIASDQDLVKCETCTLENVVVLSESNSTVEPIL